jgi:hypothetical protein
MKEEEKKYGDLVVEMRVDGGCLSVRTGKVGNFPRVVKRTTSARYREKPLTENGLADQSTITLWLPNLQTRDRRGRLRLRL